MIFKILVPPGQHDLIKEALKKVLASHHHRRNFDGSLNLKKRGFIHFLKEFAILIL